jgi:hypothetical protein
MSKLAELDKYGPESYDDYLCLRPPRLLIASLIFLCRGFVVFVLVAASREVPAMLDDLGGVDAIGVGGSLATIPAALVLYAAGARVPSARAFVRWIWKRGRALVLLSALAYISLFLARLGSNPRGWSHNTSVAANAMVLVEVAIIGYVLWSPRVRQTFRDFPSRNDA